MDNRPKKYFTTLPLQPNLGVAKYNAVDNEELRWDKETRFPIILLIAKTAEKDDFIEIVLTLIKKPEGNKVGDATMKQNYDWFVEELEQLKKEGVFAGYKITEVITRDEESIESHIKLFNDLIGNMGDDEKIYCSVTYGTKPTPIINFTALNYGYKLRKNTSVENVIYGRYFFGEADKSTVSDITPLFFMNSIINRLADGRVDNPAEVLKKLLDLN